MIAYPIPEPIVNMEWSTQRVQAILDRAAQRHLEELAAQPVVRAASGDVDPLERLSALQKIVGRLATASDDDLDEISEALHGPSTWTRMMPRDRQLRSSWL